MGTTRQTLKKKFGTPEKKAHLRVICATLGPGKAHLLELIADKHSITEAARQMKMSYKRAWQLVEEMNRALVAPAVVTAKGGANGGGAALTPTGQVLVTTYRAMEASARQAAAAEIETLTGLLAP